MEILEIFFIGMGLAMDAFAVSICKGLSIRNINIKKIIVIALYFGTFQAIMPAIGFFFGKGFEGFVIKIDHWISFVLLAFIGINMIKEACENSTEENNDDISLKIMIILAIATSIDALAVGITFAFLNVNILFAILSIGVITFVMSYIGVKIGNKFGNKYEKKAQMLGGTILILIGLKILLEHLGIF